MALIKSVRGFTPEIGENCFLADNATIIGDVKIERIVYVKNSIKLRLLNLRGVWKVIFCICKEVPSMDATSFLVCAPWARSNG